uniref:Aminotransferase-like plant mobile domain-containing protein n=1 Tax=Aegilops tauschii subsp. strangulata TaxID=200361 RepID=A0A452ZR63_AEGTS
VPPTLFHTALTALVDRWRPETHSFHLPCGEMTVTLKDFDMINALVIQGQALIGRVERKNWSDKVNALIGDCPPMKNKRTSGVVLLLPFL